MRILPFFLFCLACSVTSSSSAPNASEGPEDASRTSRSLSSQVLQPEPIDLRDAHFYAHQALDTRSRDALALDDFEVSITTAPGTLRTRIDAVIRNPSRGQKQARIRIPIPHNASVTEAVLYVGDTPMRGAFLGAARAQSVYDSYKQVRRDPLLAVWDGPDWVDVQIFPIGGQQTRRFQLEWVEPRLSGRALHRVPLLANKGQVLSSHGNVIVDGHAVTPIGGMVTLQSPARALIAGRRPGGACGYVLAAGQRPSASAVVLVAETSANMTLDYRAMQRRQIASVLATLPPSTRVSLLSADWLTKNIAVDKSPAEVKAALANLDDIVSAGSLDIANTFAEASSQATKVGAHSMVFFGQGKSDFDVDGFHPAMQALQSQEVSLFVMGPKGIKPALMTLASQSGGRTLRSKDPLLAQYLQGHGEPPTLAGVEGWTVLDSVYGQPMWMGRFLGARPKASISGAASDLDALWVRSQVYVPSGDVNRGEQHGVLTPSTSILVLESDAEYQRWGIPVPAAVPHREDKSGGVARLQEEARSVASRQGTAWSFFSEWNGRPNREVARAEALEVARGAGILGVVRSGTEGFASASSGQGQGGEQGLGGLWGTEVGEESGAFGRGIAAGGWGWGTIGTGSVGTIGHGGGAGYGMRGTSSGQARAPQLQFGDATVQGGLDKNIIRRFIRRRLARIRFCYEKELLAQPDLAGTLVANFQITSTGSVQGARASGIGNRNVESCVTQAIQSIQFPKPQGGGVVSVRYPFNFQNGDAAPTVVSPLALVLAATDKLDKGERTKLVGEKLGVNFKSASMLAWWILKEKVQAISTPVAGVLLAAQLLHDEGDEWNARRVLTQSGSVAPQEVILRLRAMGFDTDADRIAGLQP
jgi:hypothetical protein